MNQKNWMSALAAHYEAMRRRYPDETLLLLFDIDGTILDMRHMSLYILRLYDLTHATSHFGNLTLDDISAYEGQIDRLLHSLGVPEDEHQDILAAYAEEEWSLLAIFESHRPFDGVLEVIRWFELQPDTRVGLNTGRPESMRGDTLQTLNRLGQSYRVHFESDLLWMAGPEFKGRVPQAKAAGVEHFEKRGYRVIVMIDNEPENLAAIHDRHTDDDLLLLHADTLFESTRNHLPAKAVAGNRYELTALIPEQALPRRIQFVWHGVNDEANLRQFMASDINWAECDVILNPTGTRLLLRHDTFDDMRLWPGESIRALDPMLARLADSGRSIVFDLKEGGRAVDRLLRLLEAYWIDDSRLWFNGSVERLGEAGFRELRAAHPCATLQTPVDGIAELICGEPARAEEVLRTYRSWGISRLSIDWGNEHLRPCLTLLDQWGFDVNIYNVPNLEAFLQAVLWMPRSITSDFNFPQWYYFGRGSGAAGVYHTYVMPTTPAVIERTGTGD